MAGIKSEDGKKWINAFLAIMSVLVGIVLHSFFEQLGEWFELEVKVKYFLQITQAAGVLSGFLFWVFIVKNENALNHLKEVYSELVKVVWPDKDQVVKLTVGIIIGVSIISGIFVLSDLTFQKALELIY